MWLARQYLRRSQHVSAPFRFPRTYSTPQTHETDSCGIPLRPTWSVNELLSSYPSPTLSSASLDHLHTLSALIPPEEGSTQRSCLKKEMEELIRLVEAVKLVNTDGVHIVGSGEREDEDMQSHTTDTTKSRGQALLGHAARTAADFYVVDAHRKR